MARRFAAAVVVMILASCAMTWSPSKGYACSCASVSVAERLEISSAVFTGTVTRKDAEGGNVFRVDRVWKGEVPGGYVYSGFFGMCGTEFEVGKPYLVFTDQSQGRETSGLCSGNMLVAEASDEILWLDRLTKPNSKDGRTLWIWTIFGLSAAAAAIAILWWRGKRRSGNST